MAVLYWWWGGGIQFGWGEMILVFYFSFPAPRSSLPRRKVTEKQLLTVFSPADLATVWTTLLWTAGGRVSPGIGWCLQSPCQDNCLFCHNNKYIQREERRFVYLSFYSGLEQDTCSERRYWSRQASSNLPLLTIHSIIFLLTASPPWEPLHIKDMFLIWSDIGGWKHF